MRLHRAMLCVLVAVAIILAPMAAAWAGGAKVMAAAMVHTPSHAVEGEGSVAAASSMEDCASMMKGAADADECPCCDSDKACPPQLCLAKCFQVLALSQQLRPVADVLTALLRPTTPAHLRDWSDQPQPPPPRT